MPELIWTFIIISLIIQFIYWLGVFRVLLYCPQDQRTAGILPPVSILICARNEAENLIKNLPGIISQEYDDFEVIVANDHSTDHSETILKELELRSSRLNYFNVLKNIPGKKQALLEALSKANNEWVLLTDADCSVHGNQWIESMVKSIENEKTEIVLGYSPSSPEKSILSKWVHFETFISAVQYLSYAIRGIPYMGVGRNLLIKKELLESGVIEVHMDLAGGDDDLSINQLASSSNTSVCCLEDSFISTSSPKNWRAYFKQKSRHYSTAHRYKLMHILLLSAYSFSHLVFYASALLLAYYNILLSSVLIMTRFILISPIAASLFKKLKSPFTVSSFIIMDFLQAIYYTIFSFTVLFPKKNKWS